MLHFRSKCNFSQHKPHQSWWQRWRTKRSVSQESRALPSGSTSRTWQKTSTQKSGLPLKKHHYFAWAFFGLFIVWVGLLIYLPYFQITKVEYVGLKMIKPSEIGQDIERQFLDQRKWLFPTRNYFLVSERKIAKYLESKYMFSNVIVKKVFPSHLNIEVEEKISSLIYDNGGQLYLLDRDGLVIKALGQFNGAVLVVNNVASSSTSTVYSTGGGLAVTTRESIAATGTISTSTSQYVPDFRVITREFGGLPILYDSRGLTTTENKVVLTPEVVAGIIDMFVMLGKQGIGHPRYFIMDNPLSGVAVYWDKPWRLFFSPTTKIITQISRLKTVLKDNRPAEYIDLRYGGRVFWK